MSFTKQSLEMQYESTGKKIDVKVPKRGQRIPEQTLFSGLPRIQRIAIISVTNYVPGRIVFKEDKK
jgi:hypothetical protein